MSFELKDLSSFPLRNVLIVDDEQVVHDMYTNILQPFDCEQDESETERCADAKRHNFEVFNSTNGEGALEIVTRQDAQNSPIQMAFVDMRMPGWNGVETIERIHAFDSRICFIIVTGFPDQSHGELTQSVCSMPIQVIPKPFELRQIYEAAYELVAQWNQEHAGAIVRQTESST